MIICYFRCGGVVIKTVILKNKPARTNMEICLKTLKFVPFIQENNNVSDIYFIEFDARKV